MTQVEGDDLIGSESNHHKLIKETQIPTSPLESHEKTFNPTTYDCDFISIQRRNIIPIKLQLLPKEINVICSRNNLTMFSIKPDDYICIVDDLPKTTITKVISHCRITEEKLHKKILCRITHVPLNKKSKCNCFNCFFCCDCKCKTIYSERDIRTSFFLFPQNKIDDIKHTLSYYSPPPIQDLIAKNRKRKILFFVNPVSGTGKSISIWNKAKEIFDQTDIEYKVIFTERVKHAYDTVLHLGLEEYDGIVNCSGDGILHEIVNGIFHRPDRDIFLGRVAVAALPAGSANAFSKGITDYCGDDNRGETHCYYIIRGRTKKIDLQEMELTEVDKKVYSFLSLTYGMVADIDLESEVIRCVGMLRTTIWGAIRWVNLRDYFGCLYYLPKDSKMKLEDIPSIKENLDESKFIKENDNWSFFVSDNLKFIGETIKTVPLAVLDDGLNDIVALKRSTSGRCLLLKELVTYIDNGDEFIDEKGNIREGLHYYQTQFWRLIPKLHLNDPDDVNVKHNFEHFYSIDGERYPICPIQAKTLQKVLSVYCGKE